jgi:hypothetical protein
MTPFAVTFFADFAATKKTEESLSLEQLAERIRTASASAKDKLPWLKAARFGSLPTSKNSLRWDGNILGVSGAVVDYDGEKITPEDAVERLDKAGIIGLVYTSPSHMRGGHGPRWRVVCPFSAELARDQHYRMVSRLNGLFAGMLAPESFVVSQAYYYGAVNGSRAHQATLIDGTQYLDQADELDEIAIGKPNGEAKVRSCSKPEAPIGDIRAALQAIPNPVPSWGANASWVEWNNFGMAVWRASGGSEEGFNEFDSWSKKSPKYDGDETLFRWRHYFDSPPSSIGFGTLVHLARQTQRGWFPPSRRPAPDDEEEGWDQPPAEQPWPEIDAEAFHGLAGDIADTINPITEADPIAVLAQILAAFGCAFGRNAYCWVGDTKHYPNIFEIICGTTSKGRKGTSYDPVEGLLTRADPTFADCVKSGLASGEGIIHAVHDGIWVREKTTPGKGQPPSYVKVLKEDPISDKRLFVIEQELASLLAAMQRQGNSLSPVLRLAWDGRKLQTLIKHNAETATGAHLSVVGHITTDELQTLLNEVAMANGFGNRFLFVLARRSKEMPFPGRLDPDVANQLAAELHKLLFTLEWRRTCVEFSPEARTLWIAEYHDLSAEQGGLFGSVIARAEAQTLRLAMIYALLDASYIIKPEHLRAALAFWRYCQASAKYIFGDYLGNQVADDLLRALRQAGPDGLNRTELRDLFHHHSTRVTQGLLLLLKYRKARMKKRTGTGGRAAEIWIAT